MVFWPCLIFGVFRNALYVELVSKLLHRRVSNGKHKHSFLKQINFPLKDSSENICTGTSGNGRKFSISQHDVQWMFFKYFRGMSRVPSPAPSKPWQNLWSPAASGSHYMSSSKQIAVFGLMLECRDVVGFFFTALWYNYCYIVFSQHYFICCLGQWDLNAGNGGGFSYH